MGEDDPSEVPDCEGLELDFLGATGSHGRFVSQGSDAGWQLHCAEIEAGGASRWLGDLISPLDQTR